MNEFENNREESSPDLSAEAIADSFHKSLAGDGSVVDWMEANPSMEYRLWLMSRPEDADLRRQAEKRLRSAERVPIYTKLQVALGSLVTASFVVAPVAEVFQDRGTALVTLPFLAWGALFFASNTRHIWRQKLPKDYAFRDQERINFQEVFADETDHQ